MSDNPDFEIVPRRPVPPRAHDGTAVAVGDGWRVARENDGLWLYYLSPTHQGDERAILIRPDEADALAAGARTLDDVLIDNRAS